MTCWDKNKPKKTTPNKNIFDFKILVRGILSFNSIIKPLARGKYSEKIKRPKFTVLDKTKIINTYNISLVPYLESLKNCIKILKNAQ